MRRILASCFLITLFLALTGVPAAGGVARAAPDLPAMQPAPAVAWATPVRALRGQFWYGVAMGVDSAGHMHVVGSGWRSGILGLWYATDRSGSWVTKRLLTSSAGSIWVRPSLAIDARNRIHISVAKTQCVECTIADQYGVFYLTDVGRTRGTFPSLPKRLTKVGTAQGSLAVSEGHVFLAYAGNPDLALAPVQLKTNATGTWTTTRIAVSGTQPTLAIGTDGKPRVAFTDATGIRFARASSVSGGFSVELVAGSVGDSGPSLAIAPDGKPHLSWLHYDGSTQVLYSKRGASGWGALRTVAESQDQAISVGVDMVPRVVTGGTDVHEYRLVGGTFAASTIDAAHTGSQVAITSKLNGHTYAAWYGSSPDGVWVSHD